MLLLESYSNYQKAEALTFQLILLFVFIKSDKPTVINGVSVHDPFPASAAA